MFNEKEKDSYSFFILLLMAVQVRFIMEFKGNPILKRISRIADKALKGVTVMCFTTTKGEASLFPLNLHPKEVPK